jgi:hypothetical protein
MLVSRPKAAFVPACFYMIDKDFLAQMSGALPVLRLGARKTTNKQALIVSSRR